MRPIILGAEQGAHLVNSVCVCQNFQGSTSHIRIPPSPPAISLKVSTQLPNASILRRNVGRWNLSVTFVNYVRHKASDDDKGDSDFDAVDVQSLC